MTATMIRDVDIPDDVAPDGQVDNLDDVLRCVECGNELTYGGRGPKPKYCDEHKKGSAKGASSQSTRNSRNVHSRIAEGMTGAYGTLGLAFGTLYLATQDEAFLKDKDLILRHAEPIGEQWAKACDVSPKMRKRIEKFLDVGGVIGLMAVHAPLIAGIAMNHQPKPAV